MQDVIGRSIGRYHVIEKSGRGGMATVFKAFDTNLEREVAIKLIRRRAFAQGDWERTFRRFEIEAKSLARLDHPNIVRVYDYGEFEGAPFIVMELLDDGSLKQRLGRPIPVPQAAAILAPIADGLAYAHRKGILHRDVKPSNILFKKDGTPVLTDFGIAKIIEGPNANRTITKDGVGVGTPEYMAPEQGSGRQIDGRTDEYSLGIVFYEMITGRKPYTADTPLAVILKQQVDPLPRPTNVSQGAEKLLYKVLAKNPDDRFRSMDLMADAFERLVHEGEGSLFASIFERLKRPVTESSSAPPPTIQQGIRAEPQKAPPPKTVFQSVAPLRQSGAAPKQPAQREPQNLRRSLPKADSNLRHSPMKSVPTPPALRAQRPTPQDSPVPVPKPAMRRAPSSVVSAAPKSQGQSVPQGSPAPVPAIRQEPAGIPAPAQKQPNLAVPQESEPAKVLPPWYETDEPNSAIPEDEQLKPQASAAPPPTVFAGVSVPEPPPPTVAIFNPEAYDEDETRDGLAQIPETNMPVEPYVPDLTRSSRMRRISFRVVLPALVALGSVVLILIGILDYQTMKREQVAATVTESARMIALEETQAALDATATRAEQTRAIEETLAAETALAYNAQATKIAELHAEMMAATVLAIPTSTETPGFDAAGNPLPTSTPISNNPYSGCRVGDIVQFGRMEQNAPADGIADPIDWLVLDVQAGKALLLSVKAIDVQPFNSRVEGTDWEKSLIRGWLNGVFAYTSFSAEEKLILLDSTIKNSANPVFGTSSGDPTIDRLFLLSIDEVNRYFTTDVSRRILPSDAARAKGEAARTPSDPNIVWWLRTSGQFRSYAAYVMDDGSVNTAGAMVSLLYGVRPAVWIDTTLSIP